VNFQSYDINNFAGNAPAALVQEVEGVLKRLSLTVKLSGQAGKASLYVYDPIAANEFILTKLFAAGWQRIVIPPHWSALGKDIDAGKQGVWGEVQFSNYPFFINNVVRANAMFLAKQALPPMGQINSVVIVTKGKMFDAAQSTLNYEQAVAQLKLIAPQISVPVRVYGLMVPHGTKVSATATKYKGETSRTVVSQAQISVTMQQGSTQITKSP
jgi:hypothetical protein